MVQAAVRQSSYSEIISCPLFRKGYEEIWRAQRHRIDRSWLDGEQLSYERGRQFGLFVLTEEQRHVPLMKGGVVSPRASLLLLMAFRSGNVL
jgi:hypothetical protein